MWTALGILLLSACRMTVGKNNWRNHQCPAPRSPMNGLSFIFRDGEVVQYTCHPGYRMIGRHYAYCINGRWNSNSPRCVPNDGYEEFRAATSYTTRPGSKHYHQINKTSTERPLFHWEDQPRYPPYGDRENRLPLINGIWKPSQKPENLLSIGTSRIDNDVEDLIEKEKKIAELRQRQLEEVQNKKYGYTTFPQRLNHKSTDPRYHGSINVVVLPPAPEQLNKPNLFNEKQKKRRNKKNRKRKNKKRIQELRHKPESKVNVQTDQGINTDSVIERKSRHYKPSNVSNYHHKYKPYDPKNSAYDSSCYESSHGMTYPLRAPALPNSIVLKYETHKHSARADTHYMTVRYKCRHGYRFQDVRITKLYCQQGQWVGETPICVQ